MGHAQGGAERTLDRRDEAASLNTGTRSFLAASPLRRVRGSRPGARNDEIRPFTSRRPGTRCTKAPSAIALGASDQLRGQDLNLRPSGYEPSTEGTGRRASQFGFPWDTARFAGTASGREWSRIDAIQREFGTEMGQVSTAASLVLARELPAWLQRASRLRLSATR